LIRLENLRHGGDFQPIYFNETKPTLKFVEVNMKVDLKEMIDLLSKGPDDIYYYFDDCVLFTSKGKYHFKRFEGNVPTGIGSKLTKDEFGQLINEYLNTHNMCARLSRWSSSLLDQPYYKYQRPKVTLQESLKNERDVIRHFDNIEPELVDSGYKKVFNGRNGECRVYVTGVSPYVIALEKIYFSKLLV
jgi:hypothetical protein